jgi:hypothetical protein
LTASKGIRKVNATTGKQVELAKVNVEDILSYITDLAMDAEYVEEPALMAA